MVFLGSDPILDTDSYGNGICTDGDGASDVHDANRNDGA
ncbi:hypothetical protein B808_13 [Fructilactobacillus florum 8D]|uniref:Uncharacterized protein n=1 Tax=Fructilactobacillus florum 8D TaxID=1221538 RepID=W9EG61_9LACO|nr:hypothetical protein B807_1079 [Fructilactobacillus florum 2F]ETO41052.1 hypothetical protein B808_13 [Fructilactobacillus florum 8D]